MDSPVKLIVGLGNPGPDYEATRHNAGADFVTALCRRFAGSLTPNSKFFGLDARITIAGKDVRLLIPTTYMNRSGQSVAALCQFFKVAPENILVAHDELDLAPGTPRLKIGGGHGGHNGLRDIISSLGNNKNFARLRLGIGHPGNSKDVANYVLKRAPLADQQAIENAIDASLEVVETLAKGEWNKAMKDLHTTK